ncbi:MAG: DUF3737 family protein [Lachnospiraceae bacterium]|nr:DUF3737 family protein [Lachnospiraceae bacterium]
MELYQVDMYKDETFDEERALYGSDGAEIVSCRFDGPQDGESALKESRNIMVKDSYFNLRYPFWHNDNLSITTSELTSNCRAAIWYSTNVNITDSKISGIKALRECENVKISGSNIVSPEFGWYSKAVQMSNSGAESEYFMLRSDELTVSDFRLLGKYSFQYITDSTFVNCKLDTKDAFWHAKNVLVKDSIIKGEYLAWYSENLTLDNCTIIGTQPLCYCKNLKLINCKMKKTDLAFEKSDVDAEVTTIIDSIKNPASGIIRTPGVGEVILDDPNSKARIKTLKTSIE